MPVKNLGFARAIIGATVAPTNIQMIWFDQNPGQLIHKVYNQLSGLWEALGGGGGGSFLPEITSPDLTDRDSLTGLSAGQRVFVLDATGGPTPKDHPGDGPVNAGWGLYRWDGIQYFFKMAEEESLDVTAAVVTYAPTTPADWGLLNPTTVKEGLDKLAARHSTYDDKEFPITVSTTADGDATPVVLSNYPVGYVDVRSNGRSQIVGDAVKTKDCYWSDNLGVTAKALSALAPGDVLYWNGSIAGFQLLAGSFIISLHYIK